MLPIKVCLLLLLLGLCVVVVVVVVVAELPNPEARRQEASSSSSTFLWLSDLHYDPYYGTSQAMARSSDYDCAFRKDTSSSSSSVVRYGQVGCDSPPALLQVMLQHAARLTANETTTPRAVDFVIITGDWVRHGNDRLSASPLADTQNILVNVTQMLQSALGGGGGGGTNISIIPALGNNDFTPDYYIDVLQQQQQQQQPNNELLAMVTQGLGALLTSDTERATFAAGGYLARNVTDTLTIVSLNTVIYAVEHQPNQTQVRDPLAQFAWLKGQLQQASHSNRRVYIMGHIPPAVGSYRHSQLWHDAYATQYWTLLEAHENVVAGQFFGHLHADESRLLTTTTTTTNHHPLHWSLLLTSSITPIYGANPSLRQVTYNVTNGMVLDYDSYYLDLQSANATIVKGPSFGQSFGVSDLSAASLQTILDELQQTVTNPHAAVWKALVDRQHVFFRNDKNDDDDDACDDLPCRTAWLCVLTAKNKQDFETCTTLSTDDWEDARVLPIRWLILAVLLVAGFVVGVCALLNICWKKCCLGRQQYHQPSVHVTDHVHDHEQPNNQTGGYGAISNHGKKQPTRSPHFSNGGPMENGHSVELPAVS